MVVCVLNFQANEFHQRNTAEDVTADRHEPHNINPNRPALTRQDISV